MTAEQRIALKTLQARIARNKLAAERRAVRIWIEKGKQNG